IRGRRRSLLTHHGSTDGATRPGRAECRSAHVDGHRRRCARQRVFCSGAGPQPRLSASASRHRGHLLHARREARLDGHPPVGRGFQPRDRGPKRAALLCLTFAALGAQRPPADFEALPFAPRSYVCHRAPAPLVIDGKLDEPAWASASWSDPFVDIEGDRRPRPRFRTRMKMAWDDEYLYVAAELEDPDVWA